MKKWRMTYKKLLLIGGTSGSVHIKNYFHLIRDLFDDVLIVSNEEVDFCPSKVLSFSLKNPVAVKKSIKALSEIISTYNPTVIHAHQANSFSFITVKANKKKIPLVVTAWGSDVLTVPQKGFLYRYIVKTALKGADAITTDAAFIGKSIAALGISKKVDIINFGVDLMEGNNRPEKEQVIYSNRLHKDLYNIDAIIKAFSKLPKNNNYKLVIGANGTNTDELKAQVQRLDIESKVNFIGFVNAHENFENYQRAKIWVSVPNSDGTAVSLLEAMAYGCIPIVSDLPANREWITDGLNGIIVTNNDLEDGMLKAMAMNQAEVARLNRDIINKKATKSICRELFKTVYKTVI